MKMMQVILHLYDQAQKLVAASVPLSAILETGLFDRVVKMKYDVPNDNIALLDSYTEDIDKALRAIGGESA